MHEIVRYVLSESRSTYFRLEQGREALKCYIKSVVQLHGKGGSYVERCVCVGKGWVALVIYLIFLKYLMKMK